MFPAGVIAVLVIVGVIAISMFSYFTNKKLKARKSKHARP
ncbi:DEBR0S1_07888g1_1 [Brettanomyces bruxellensis]|uniref:DEBR0S1_07888g1_1 n=1 Tax=Dekkera bruxellensis TaxID=5007 RepID=A0A7D9GYG5_DEKBR|nr:DEBR0S1_07888g1_1 [Brettanomyces bruxellensis]